MADGHPNSCAHATIGSVCHCECSGVRHSVAVNGGIPAPGTAGGKTDKAAAPTGKHSATGAGHDFQARDYYNGLHVNGKPMTENPRGWLPDSALDERGTRAAKLWVEADVSAAWANALRAGRTDVPILHRGDTVNLDDLTADMDHAVSQGRLTEDTELWRGIVLDPADAERLFPEGATFRDPSFTATAFRRVHAEHMLARRSGGSAGGQPYLLRIQAPAGTPAAPGADAVTEAVLGRDSGLRVLSVEQAGTGPHLINVEVIA